MPLVVLAAGQSTDPSFLPPDWPLAEEEELHRELQMDLAARVPGGQYELVEESGHYIQLEQPDLVIDAIADVIEAVRDPASWNAAAPGTPTSASAPVASLDTLLEASLDRGLTGVALAVDQGGEVLFDGVAGLANSETQTPLAPTDRFESTASPRRSPRSSSCNWSTRVFSPWMTWSRTGSMTRPSRASPA